MGRGGYLGASTIVILGSRKWQSEDFYALPLAPKWKSWLQNERKAAAAQKGERDIPPEQHINDGVLLRRAIMERNPYLLEKTKEMEEARLHCLKNVNIFMDWLTQEHTPFIVGPKGRFIKFSWKKAKILARLLGLRARWPPKRKLSTGDIEILKRVCNSAVRVLLATYPAKDLTPVIYIDDE